MKLKSRAFGRDLRAQLKKGTGIEFLKRLGKTQDWIHQFIPELLDCVATEGGHHHNETVFEHLLQTLEAARGQSVQVQMAALLHDIGKPASYNKDEDGHISFHSHEVPGTKIAHDICLRLGFPKREADYISKLVRYHMFRFEKKVKRKTLQRWLLKVGHMWEDLFALREADRRGNSLNKDKPTITREMKDLRKKIEGIIRDNNAVFEEDLNITKKQIRELSKKTRRAEVIPTLIGLVNSDETRNTPEWLCNYVKRVFG